MKLTYSPIALRHIRDIYLYILRDDPGAADRVRNRIHAVAEFVAQYPGGGRATFTPGLRAVPVGPYPYVVYFRVYRKRHEVRVVRVLHGARQRPALREDAAEFRFPATS